MNLARISANGQITVPVEIRRALGLKKGDKILFMRKENGEYTIGNASAAAIRDAQNAFSGLAEQLGHPTEEEIQSWVNEIRYGKDQQL